MGGMGILSQCTPKNSCNYCYGGGDCMGRGIVADDVGKRVISEQTTDNKRLNICPRCSYSKNW